MTSKWAYFSSDVFSVNSYPGEICYNITSEGTSWFSVEEKVEGERLDVPCQVWIVVMSPDEIIYP